MKTLTDNENTSTFVHINITSRLLTKLLKKYQFQSEHVTATRCFRRTCIEIEDGYTEVPLDLNDFFEKLVSVLAEYGANTSINTSCLKALSARKQDIIDAIEFAEIDYQVLTWGNDKTRFNRNNYSPIDLERMDEMIARKNHCTVEEITQEAFEEYVMDAMACETTMFVYDKAKNIMDCGHAFELDIQD